MNTQGEESDGCFCEVRLAHVQESTLELCMCVCRDGGLPWKGSDPSAVRLLQHLVHKLKSEYRSRASS
jgi:hypothetical protein